MASIFFERNFPQPPLGKTGWPWTKESPQLPETRPDGCVWPRISIVTPSYNQGQFIEETIRSVLLQGYPNLEYIIVDGGSTDNSIEIIKKYEPWLKYWVSEPDHGQSQAINKGFRHASGDIYAFINSDDYYLPGAFGHVANSFNGSIGMLVGISMQVGLDGVLKGERRAPSLAFEDVADWQTNWFRQPACFFSRTAFEKAGGIDEDLQYALDFDLELGIIKEIGAARVEKKLAVARNHPTMKTRNSNGRGFAEDRIVQIKHGAQELAIKEMVLLHQKVNYYESKLSFFYSAVNFLSRMKRSFLRKMNGEGKRK